jgi:hypothetical protein
MLPHFRHVPIDDDQHFGYEQKFLKKEPLITTEANCGSPKRLGKSCTQEEMGVSQVTEAKMAFTNNYRV